MSLDGTLRSKLLCPACHHQEKTPRFMRGAVKPCSKCGVEMIAFHTSVQLPKASASKGVWRKWIERFFPEEKRDPFKRAGWEEIELKDWERRRLAIRALLITCLSRKKS